MATVLAVDSDFELAVGEGNPVTGRYRTSEVDLIARVTLDSGDVVSGTTKHTIWSVSRRSFVEMAELQDGELVDTEWRVASVQSVEVINEPQAVFNLKIAGQHVFRIGKTGVLVHNVDPTTYDDLAENASDVAPRSVDEALEAGLSIKDKQWPWRGLHKTEGHHPLLQGKTYKEFWKERGLSAKQVDDWIEDLDTDIHRAITESGWWDKKLFDEIARQEKLKNGLLNRDETIKIAKDLLDEIAGWGK